MKIIATLKQQDRTTVSVNADGYILISQESSLGGDPDCISIAPENAELIADAITRAMREAADPEIREREMPEVGPFPDLGTHARGAKRPAVDEYSKAMRKALEE
jgi:hypothetical protein